MATPADQRLLELCDKWLKSLELHIRYSSLDSDSYWKVQPWPEHQRPSRWIIDLAVQKAVSLRSQVQERIKQGDTRFSDSLELMTFLANLIGSEHIERFIPLADPENEVALTVSGRATPATFASDDTTGTRQMPELAAPPPHQAAPRVPAPRESPSGETPRRETPPRDISPRAAPAPEASSRVPAPRETRRRDPQPQVAPTPAAAIPRSPAVPPRAPRSPDPAGATATREMPEFAPPKRRAPPVGTENVARTERNAAQAKSAARPSTRQPARMEDSEDAAREQVIADAARLVQWGRKWYELAELIARMADRPPLAEVRKILKEHKTAIDQKAGSG